MKAVVVTFQLLENSIYFPTFSMSSFQKKKEHTHNSVSTSPTATCNFHFWNHAIDSDTILLWYSQTPNKLTSQSDISGIVCKVSIIRMFFFLLLKSHKYENCGKGRKVFFFFLLILPDIKQTQTRRDKGKYFYSRYLVHSIEKCNNTYGSSSW